jgi:hypothetical protein
MAGLRAGVGDHSDRFMRDHVEEIDHQRLGVRRPQFDEGRALGGARDRLVAELETLRGLLAAIQEAARPRTSWLGGWRWLLKAS